MGSPGQTVMVPPVELGLDDRVAETSACGHEKGDTYTVPKTDLSYRVSDQCQANQ